MKIQQSELRSYLFNLVPQSNRIYNTQQSDKLERFSCRTNVFKNSLVAYVIDELNKLKTEITNVGSYLKFRKLILNLHNDRPISNPIYNIFNPVGVKYLTRLRLELSHLSEHRFNHNF